MRGLIYSLVGCGLILGSVGRAAEDIWARLRSDDITTFADNLRGAGIPTDTVAIIISHEVNQRFRDREAQLQPNHSNASSLRQEFSPERREALLQLRLEKNEILRAALGTVPTAKAQFEWPAAVLNRLSERERDVVRAITDDYDLMIGRVMTEARGYLLDDDREKLRFLETERAADLRKVLTEEEVLDFEIATTGYGREIRVLLQVFEPTPEQLRTYLRLAKETGLAHLARSKASQQFVARRREFEDRLAATWDAETYTRYRRSISINYVALHLLVRRLKLDPEIALRIHDSARATTEEGMRLFRQTASWETPTSAPAGVRSTTLVIVPNQPEIQAAQAKVAVKMRELVEAHARFARTLLGERGYTAYADVASGWMEPMRRGQAVQLDPL
jgi:hypothetical protein